MRPELKDDAMFAADPVMAGAPAMRVAQLPQRSAPARLFLREVVRDAGSMGALCSSSQRLAAGIAAKIDVHADGLVVELGGGTGAITQALLARGLPARQLVVIEKSPRLAAYLQLRFPAVRIIEGDAAAMGALIDGCGPAASIVSGLPLRSLQASEVQAIVGHCAPLLPAHGRLVQFTYALGARSPWTRGGLVRVASQWVWGNLPPARIEVFTRR